jgi:hypothetical protein
MRATLVALVLVLCAVPASAGVITFSGTTSGLFTGPVLTGRSINTDGTLTAVYDNTLSAVYSGMGTNAVQWGDCPAVIIDPVTGADSGCGANNGVARFSALSFTGTAFSNVAANTDFLLGTLTYSNGTSRSTTVIFGLTAEISIALSGGGVVDPKVAAGELWGTLNANDPANPNRDADFVYFPFLLVSFNVLEGSTSTANVYGRIVGDPYLEVTRLEATDANGYVGNGPADFVVPEPSAWTLLGAGLVSLFVLRRRMARG